MFFEDLGRRPEHGSGTRVERIAEETSEGDVSRLRRDGRVTLSVRRNRCLRAPGALRLEGVTLIR